MRCATVDPAAVRHRGGSGFCCSRPPSRVSDEPPTHASGSRDLLQACRRLLRQRPLPLRDALRQRRQGGDAPRHAHRRSGGTWASRDGIWRRRSGAFLLGLCPAPLLVSPVPVGDAGIAHTLLCFRALAHQAIDRRAGRTRLEQLRRRFGEPVQLASDPGNAGAASSVIRAASSLPPRIASPPARSRW